MGMFYRPDGIEEEKMRVVHRILKL